MEKWRTKEGRVTVKKKTQVLAIAEMITVRKKKRKRYEYSTAKTCLSRINKNVGTIQKTCILLTMQLRTNPKKKLTDPKKKKRV
jgi:hypothetical protein